MKKLFSLVFIFLSLQSSAQKIFGTVFDDKGDLLPYASITIKGTTAGASANNRARYSITVSPGTYTIICQHIGYTAVEKKITIKDTDEELPFILSVQKLTMKEVTIRSNGEDPAYAIIRQAINHRSANNKEVKSFQCNLYTKDMIKVRQLPKKIFGKKIPDEDIYGLGLDSTGKGIIYLSESISTITKTLPDKVKLEVKSSRVSGSDQFGLTFPLFINFYQNNVEIFAKAMNPRGFISPIANGAFNYYRFKFLGSFWENGIEINSIRIMPKRDFEPLFNGVINITEGDWRIHSIDVGINKKAQLDILDSLHISQIHVPVNKDQWRVKNQLLHFDLNQLGVDLYGNFLSVYSNYNLQPVLPKGFYNNVVIKYDTGVTKRPRVYWDSVRPVPLERDEIRDYQVKDSVFDVKKEPAYTQKLIDSLKAKQGAIKWYKLLWGGIDRTHYGQTSKFTWGIEAIPEKMEYNPAEGVVLNVPGYINKHIKRLHSDLSIEPNIRYGFSNKHLNGWIDVKLERTDWQNDKKLKRETWSFSGGKRVSQFNRESPITPLVNTFSTLLWGDNLMKTYENSFFAAGFAKRFENGFTYSINSLYENRLPLDNTTDFTLIKKSVENITPNYPYDKISTQFEKHQAAIISVDVSINPGQKYIEFPNKKIPLGSKYPTFSLNYTKGIKNVLGSDVDFDKWMFTINDDVDFNLSGLLKLKTGIGGFFNRKSVFIHDFRHFNGNRSVVAGEYLNSFQLAQYYANSTVASSFAVAHLEHHFSGSLSGKIPYFNKLNWNFVAGSNAFYVNNSNNYIEMFIGLENILKILRVDYVVAFESGGKTITGIRIGTGGTLGSRIKTREYKRRETFGGGL